MSDWIKKLVDKQKAESPAVPVPSDHPFEPAKPGSEQCKWCMFHERAHTKET